jgi:uncharacterized protein (TIGR03435 family)
MNMKALAAIVIALGSVAWCQDHPEFEVASIRPAGSARPQEAVLGLQLNGSQARMALLTMQDLLAMAYRVKAYQVSGPDWINRERFDISAKLPEGASTRQIPEMLQTLLTERFQIKMHREKKELPVYLLLSGKPPLKLKESPRDAVAEEPRGTVNIAASGSAQGVSVNMGNGSYYTFADNKFEVHKVSMDALAVLLERYLDRPIVNQTEIQGNYDLTLPVTEEDYRTLLIRAAVNSGVTLPPQALRLLDSGSPASLFDALQQLGLKLEARKSPLDVVVIDQMLKTPTEN